MKIITRANMQILPVKPPFGRVHQSSLYYNIRKVGDKYTQAGQLSCINTFGLRLDAKWIMAHKAVVLERWEQPD